MTIACINIVIVCYCISSIPSIIHRRQYNYDQENVSHETDINDSVTGQERGV